MRMEVIPGIVFLVFAVSLLFPAVLLIRKYRRFERDGIYTTGYLRGCTLKNDKQSSGPVVSIRLPDQTEKTVHAQCLHLREARKHVGENVEVVYIVRKFCGQDAVNSFLILGTDRKPYRIYKMIAVILAAAAALTAAVSLIFFFK